MSLNINPLIKKIITIEIKCKLKFYLVNGSCVLVSTTFYSAIKINVIQYYVVTMALNQLLGGKHNVCSAGPKERRSFRGGKLFRLN